MKFECLLIADQLRRAFIGDPWHGPPLSDLLAGVTAQHALARPFPSAKNIWELVLHIDLWAGVTLGAIDGTAMPWLYGSGKDWSEVAKGSATEWAMATTHLFKTGEQLAQAIADFPDSRLQDTVPGRDYNFYYLFHGIVQHCLYHGGQIAVLAKALSVPAPAW